MLGRSLDRFWNLNLMLVLETDLESTSKSLKVLVVVKLLFMKLLFVCSQNRLRSPTVKAVFLDYQGLEVELAGLDREAEIPCMY